MEEHMREKEMASIAAESDARREEEARMMAKLNGVSQTINLNQESMSTLEEHMREKEMSSIAAESDARREEEARMMAKLNGAFDYSDGVNEEVVHRRR